MKTFSLHYWLILILGREVFYSVLLPNYPPFPSPPLPSLPYLTYSSSPKKTLTGNHASPQTLNLSRHPSNSRTCSALNAHPSSSKLRSMRCRVTLFGITLHPFCTPHASNTCCGVLPTRAAICSKALSGRVKKGESVLPRQE